MFEDQNVVELAWTVVGSAIFALVGFVWKISHRVTTLQNRVDAMERAHQQEVAGLRREVDTIFASVDKNREWTTSRMMSIAKDLKG